MTDNNDISSNPFSKDGAVVLRNAPDRPVPIDRSKWEAETNLELPLHLQAEYQRLNGVGRDVEYLRELNEKLKKSDPTHLCVACGGQPVAKQICEVCGAGSIAQAIVKAQSLTENQIAKLQIPPEYQGKYFDSFVLDQYFPGLDSKSNSYKQYKQVATQLVATLSKRERINQSYLLCAPTGFGKMHLGYTLLQLAETQGLKTFPLLDLMEVKRLIEAFELRTFKELLDARMYREAAEARAINEAYAKSIGFSDAELYDADVVVLKFPKGHDSYGAYKIMLQILDRRARRGKATIFLSAYNLFAITELDRIRETNRNILTDDSTSVKRLRVVDVNERERR